jgi:hypothetical protein
VALETLAAKKYGQSADGLAKISALVISSSPQSSGTAVPHSAIVDKLTDTSLYTGAHKARFDNSGNGLGLQGRETVTNTADLSQIVNRSTTLTPGKRGVTMSMEGMNNQQQSAPAARPIKAGKNTASNYTATTPSRGMMGSNKSLNASKSPSKSLQSVAPKTGGNVYDRLTDSSKYTGAHKLRFDADGKGRGKAGRDNASNNNVNDLSQILRN